MLGRMTIVAIPKMSTPWKAVVVAMAIFGFVCGYTGTAGSNPWACASIGQCLQWTLDRGFPGFFYPAALGPGAGWALLFGAVAYVLFLTVYGIRKAFRREPDLRSPLLPWVAPQAAQRENRSAPTKGVLLAASGSGEKEAAPTVAVPSAASASIGTQPALTEEFPAAVNGVGRRRSARPTALLLAVGLALAWAILSVGPARLVSDLNALIPRNEVTAPFCGLSDPLPGGGPCPATTTSPGGGTVWAPAPICHEYLGFQLESDGMCHLQSDLDAQHLLSDVVVGAENGLLAFLAVGAALLLLPRLRAAMMEPSLGQAEIQHPGSVPGKSDQPAVGPGEKVGDKLRQLAALRDDGIISAEEFETKKAELLRTF